MKPNPVTEAARQLVETCNEFITLHNRQTNLVLEAMGTLVVLGEKPAVSKTFTRRVRRHVQTWSFEELGVAAIDILIDNDNASDLGKALLAGQIDGINGADAILFEGFETHERMREALITRDTVELRIIGAEYVLGSTYEHNDDAGSCLDAFAELIKPCVPICDEDSIAWLPRRYRGAGGRFWWRQT